MKFTPSTTAWTMAYVVCIAVVVGVMWRARTQTLDTLGTARAQVEWKRWRDEAERQSGGQGPVLRRPPQTVEPPALVLLRDHFATSVLGMILLSSAIFFALMTMIRGVVAGPKFEVDLESGERDGLQ
jgi:hypothetical protein